MTLTGIIPDVHHYNGRGGRVFPLWRDDEATIPNLRPKLLSVLAQRYATEVGAEDVVAYIAAVAAHPAYTARFRDDLSVPGLRIPLTADREVFAEAVALGRRIIWLHTFGARMSDESEGRPAQPPRLPAGTRPFIPKDGTIPEGADEMPDTIDYDAAKKRLRVGMGYVENVEPEVWHYEVSGKQVLPQWFSYRKKHRERPMIGDRRKPSALGDIQPQGWLPEYTTELVNVLNVLALVVEMEPKQAALLERVCAGPLISGEEFREDAILEATPAKKSKKRQKDDCTVPMF